MLMNKMFILSLWVLSVYGGNHIPGITSLSSIEGIATVCFSFGLGAFVLCNVLSHNIIIDCNTFSQMLRRIKQAYTMFGTDMSMPCQGACLKPAPWLLICEKHILCGSFHLSAYCWKLLFACCVHWETPSCKKGARGKQGYLTIWQALCRGLVIFLCTT